MNGHWIRHPAGQVLVIFVHGVLSSGETCWKGKNGSYWPTLLDSDARVTGAGIYVYTYKTNIFSGTYRIGDVVDDLKERMQLERMFDCSSLIFVAHSMGGIVVRKLLVERAADFERKKISVGLFLLASPSLGASFANFFTPIARLMHHSHAEVLRFSQDNAWLMDLNREFKNLRNANRFEIFGKEIVEDVFVVLPGWIRKQVVSPIEGAAEFAESYKVPGSDHFSIAKPESAESIQHQLLIRFVAQRLVPELEPELNMQLCTRMQACKDARLPIRTYHKLAAVFAMSDAFAILCFDAVVKGSSLKIKQWLHEAIAQQDALERGSGGDNYRLEDDQSVRKAREKALREGASTIDSRHLLLVILADRESGTMKEIVDKLTERRVAEIEQIAESRRPIRARTLSPVPSFDIDEKLP